jgi:predicted nucleotidyltransferase
MHPIITDNLDAIRALAREYGVRRLEVFGSICTDEFDPESSDVDFLVDYPEDYDFGPWLSRYQDLKRALEMLLGLPVDLVMTKAAKNPYFLHAANETRQLLYAA